VNYVVEPDTPSDTTKLPPPGQSDLVKGHVEARDAAHRDLQVAGEDGDHLHKLLDEHPPLLLGRLFPDGLDVHVRQKRGHLLEPFGQLRCPRRFRLVLLALTLQSRDPLREPILLLPNPPRPIRSA
jgi:hypothetical protein